ncbi:MAG: glycosyl hydrolase family 28-related protein [Flavobacterium sp.]|nr:glycosyl hydrolase family 28-related protein [Flavobacterium sp.]
MQKLNKLLLIFLLVSIKLYSQVPQGTSYQGLAKDKNGNPLTNKLVSIRISILDDSEKGKVVYSETFNNGNTPENALRTDENGLFSLSIGFGTPETGKFKEINWGLNNKFLKVEMDIENDGMGTNYMMMGTTQLMSVPYALFAQNAQSLSGGTLSMVDTINDLRYVDCATTTTVYVRGYYSPGDGGGGIFIWENEFDKNSGYRYLKNYKRCKDMNICEDGDNSFIDENGGDNGGTIIRTFNAHCSGKWIRQYESYINIKFFGVMSTGGNYTCEIQKAIDFAEINADDDPYLKGSVVYIPNGSYFVDNGLVLKNGTTLLGESIARTIFYATGNCWDAQKSLFNIEEGPVLINVSNFSFLGTNQSPSKPTSCFNFEAKHNIPGSGNNLDPAYHGGLWDSTLKNINIGGFSGDGIILNGGGNEDYLIPNQFNIFENVRVFRANSDAVSLRIVGQAGQLSFINCEFDGFKNSKATLYAHNYNVIIKNKGYQTGNVISFLNCTFQDSDYGVYIDYADGVTFDTCWFENLGVSLHIQGSEFASKAVNVLNNRFANAAGFGSLNVDKSNITAGVCVRVINALVNINNNTVTTSSEANTADDAFVLADENNIGVNLSGNAFRWKTLGRTYGILQYVAINTATNELDCKNNKLVFVNNSGIIDRIVSDLNAGERLAIRAENGPIEFSHFNNIFLINTAPFTSGDYVTLKQGEIAVFIKIDNNDMNGLNTLETYQMISIMRVTEPQN